MYLSGGIEGDDFETGTLGIKAPRSRALTAFIPECTTTASNTGAVVAFDGIASITGLFT